MHCNIPMRPLRLAQLWHHLFKLAVALGVMRYRLDFLIGWDLTFSRVKK